MTRIQRIRMTRQDYTRLHHELAELRSRRRSRARQARIREIEDVLTNAVISEDVHDPVAGQGMVLTIRYDPTGETETFLLGTGAESADIKVYSTLSPLGHAMVGARPGEQRIYALPDETGVLVTLLKAVPYETYRAKSPGRRQPTLPPP